MIDSNGSSLASLVALAQTIEPVKWKAWRDAFTVWLHDLMAVRASYIIEGALVSAALFCGFWLLNPDWQPLARPGAYYLTRQVPEWFWGIAFLGNGLHWGAGLVAAWVGKSWAARHCFVEAGLAYVLWGSFFFDFLIYSPGTLGPPLFFLPWLLTWYCLLHLWVVITARRL